MRLFVVLLLVRSAVVAQPATLDGTAINGGSGEPLGGVHISLAKFSNDFADSYGAMSDANGHFSVSGVAAGTYMLLPDRTGFIYIEGKRKGGLTIPTIVLKPGEHVTDFKLKMTPVAVISGRVVDEAGDPVQDAQVYEEPASPDTAPAATHVGPSITRSDDRGIFRLLCAPGNYYVRAMPPNRGDDSRAEIRTDGSSPVVYGPTWYPNAPIQESAALVDVAAGTEVGGIDIHLARQAQEEALRSVAVTGMVRAIPGTSLQGHTQIWVARDAAHIFGWVPNPRAPEPDGSFALRLHSGSYRIWATYTDERLYLQSDPIQFQADTDRTGIELALQSAGDLSGIVEMAGQGRGAPQPKRTVRLGGCVANTNRDGSFHCQGIQPGSYRVEVEPLPKDGYVESIALDGTSIEGTLIDLPRGVQGSMLKITVVTGGQIFGTVLYADGRSTGNSLVRVMLAPIGSEIPGERVIAVDYAGNYGFDAVRPGRYRIIAYDPVTSNLRLLKDVIEGGDEVEVSRGSHQMKDLRVREVDSGHE